MARYTNGDSTEHQIAMVDEVITVTSLSIIAELGPQVTNTVTP